MQSSSSSSSSTGTKRGPLPPTEPPSSKRIKIGGTPPAVSQKRRLPQNTGSRKKLRTDPEHTLAQNIAQEIKTQIEKGESNIEIWERKRFSAGGFSGDIDVGQIAREIIKDNPQLSGTTSLGLLGAFLYPTAWLVQNVAKFSFGAFKYFSEDQGKKERDLMDKIVARSRIEARLLIQRQKLGERNRQMERTFRQSQAQFAINIVTTVINYLKEEKITPQETVKLVLSLVDEDTMNYQTAVQILQKTVSEDDLEKYTGDRTLENETKVMSSRNRWRNIQYSPKDAKLKYLLTQTKEKPRPIPMEGGHVLGGNGPSVSRLVQGKKKTSKAYPNHSAKTHKDLKRLRKIFQNLHLPLKDEEQKAVHYWMGPTCALWLRKPETQGLCHLRFSFLLHALKHNLVFLNLSTLEKAFRKQQGARCLGRRPRFKGRGVLVLDTKTHGKFWFLGRDSDNEFFKEEISLSRWINSSKVQKMTPKLKKLLTLLQREKDVELLENQCHKLAKFENLQ